MINPLLLGMNLAAKPYEPTKRDGAKLHLTIYLERSNLRIPDFQTLMRSLLLTVMSVHPPNPEKSGPNFSS